MRLETDRLVIKPLTLANLDDYAAMVADPAVMRYLNEGVPRTREYASNYLGNLVKQQKEKGFTRYGVFARSDGELLGHCGYKDIEGRIDIGWTYVRRVWGKGIGTEAAKAVLKYGFDALDFADITARTVPENKGSVGIMKAVGMRLTNSFLWEDESNPDFPGIEVVEYQVSLVEWGSQH